MQRKYYHIVHSLYPAQLHCNVHISIGFVFLFRLDPYTYGINIASENVSDIYARFYFVFIEWNISIVIYLSQEP